MSEGDLTKIRPGRGGVDTAGLHHAAVCRPDRDPFYYEPHTQGQRATSLRSGAPRLRSLGQHIREGGEVDGGKGFYRVAEL